MADTWGHHRFNIHQQHISSTNSLSVSIKSSSKTKTYQPREQEQPAVKAIEASYRADACLFDPFVAVSKYLVCLIPSIGGLQVNIIITAFTSLRWRLC
jgi:hypothetical protein